MIYLPFLKSKKQYWLICKLSSDHGLEMNSKTYLKKKKASFVLVFRARNYHEWTRVSFWTICLPMQKMFVRLCVKDGWMIRFLLLRLWKRYSEVSILHNLEMEQIKSLIEKNGVRMVLICLYNNIFLTIFFLSIYSNVLCNMEPLFPLQQMSWWV